MPKKSKNITNNQIEVEKKIEKESAGALSNQSEEEKSKKIVINFFERSDKELFKDYTENYYGHLNVEKAKELLEIIMETEKGDRINLKDLDKSAREKGLEGQGSELLENYCIYDFIIRKAIKTILKIRPEDHLEVLDVGGGPTIYQHILMSTVALSIIHAEYLDENIEKIEKEKSGESKFDWSTYYDYYRNYLKINPESIENADENVKKKVLGFIEQKDSEELKKYVLKLITTAKADVFAEDLGLTSKNNYDLVNISKEGSVDLLTSHFCVESATDDKNEWKKGINNIAKKVKPQGFLLMTAIRNASWYKTGDADDMRAPATPVDADILSKELINNGFKILELSELVDSPNEGSEGYDGMVFILAQKN